MSRSWMGKRAGLVTGSVLVVGSAVGLSQHTAADFTSTDEDGVTVTYSRQGYVGTTDGGLTYAPRPAAEFRAETCDLTTKAPAEVPSPGQLTVPGIGTRTGTAASSRTPSRTCTTASPADLCTRGAGTRDPVRADFRPGAHGHGIRARPSTSPGTGSRAGFRRYRIRTRPGARRCTGPGHRPADPPAGCRGRDRTRRPGGRSHVQPPPDQRRRRRARGRRSDHVGTGRSSPRRCRAAGTHRAHRTPSTHQVTDIRDRGRRRTRWPTTST